MRQAAFFGCMAYFLHCVLMVLLHDRFMCVCITQAQKGSSAVQQSGAAAPSTAASTSTPTDLSSCEDNPSVPVSDAPAMTERIVMCQAYLLMLCKMSVLSLEAGMTL